MTPHDPDASIIGPLTAGIAHDYNNILSILNGYLHILSQSRNDDLDLQQKLQLMRNATQRAEEINNALLTLSPIKMTDHASSCDLIKTVNEAIPLIRSLLGSRIDLRLHLPADKIIIHTPRIQATKDILIKIAELKSNPETKSITLDITTHASTVILTLNAVEALVYDLYQENTIFADKTVLIVDDEETLLPILEYQLHEMGMTVLKAANADTALLLQKNYPDVIDFLLTDIVMPDVDGIQLAEMISDDRPRMGVVYMTGHGLAADVPQDSLILPKPLHPDTLSEALLKALEKVQDA